MPSTGPVDPSFMSSGREGGELDRLEEIKTWMATFPRKHKSFVRDNFDWLIAEVERLRAECEKLRSTNFTARVICQTQKEENARLRKALRAHDSKE